MQSSHARTCVYQELAELSPVILLHLQVLLRQAGAQATHCAERAAGQGLLTSSGARQPPRQHVPFPSWHRKSGLAGNAHLSAWEIDAKGEGGTH